MKYQKFIFVTPATIHKASSGKNGQVNITGNNTVALSDINFWALILSSSPINQSTNLTPPYLPTKNIAIEDDQHPIIDKIKPVVTPNILTDNNVNVNVVAGIKHNNVVITICNNKYII